MKKAWFRNKTETMWLEIGLAAALILCLGAVSYTHLDSCINQIREDRIDIILEFIFLFQFPADFIHL